MTLAEDIRKKKAQAKGTFGTAEYIAAKVFEILEAELLTKDSYTLSEHEMSKHARSGTWSWPLERDVIALIRDEGFFVVPNPTDHSEGQKISNTYRVSLE